jgi:hypothetical protein
MWSSGSSGELAGSHRGGGAGISERGCRWVARIPIGVGGFPDECDVGRTRPSRAEAAADCRRTWLDQARQAPGMAGAADESGMLRRGAARTGSGRRWEYELRLVTAEWIERGGGSGQGSARREMMRRRRWVVWAGWLPCGPRNVQGREAYSRTMNDHEGNRHESFFVTKRWQRL